MPSSAAKPEPATLQEGDKAPSFSMPTDKGDVASLAGYSGKNIVLYFYPKDDTPGCTLEAKDFKDRMEAFASANTVIIGVSKDSLKSHEKFRQKYCLPFILASDEESQVCEAYGVWVEKSMYGKRYMGVERATFLIDSKGKLQRIWRKVKVDGHAEEVLQAAQSLG